MGDIRFEQPYERVRVASDRAQALYALTDEEVVQALAAASRKHDPLLANVLATEAINRMRRSNTAMTHLGEGVIACDAEGRVTSLNPAASRILGYAREEIVGRDLHEFSRHRDEHGLPIPREACPVLGVLRTHAPVEREGDIFARKDGSRFHVAYTAAPILRDGEAQGVVVAFHDVTERREAAERLRRSEQRYRTLYHALPFMTFTVGPDLRIRSVNDVTVRHLGHSREDLAGKPILDLYAPEDRARMARVHAEALARDGIHRNDVRKLRKDGTPLDVRETTTRTQDPQGEYVLVTLCEDITERRRHERALAESHQRFRSLFEGNPEGIVMVDLEGRILDANPASMPFTGYTPEEVRGHSFTEYLDPADLDRVWGLFEKVLSGQTQRAEFGIRHKEGHVIPARVTGIPVLVDGEVVGVYGVEEDLREEKRARAVHTQLMHAALDAIVTIDRDSVILAWNPAAEKMFGYAAAEVLGRRMTELIVPERLREAHERGLRRQVETGESRILGSRYVMPAVRKDGTEFDAEISIARLPGAEPLFTGFVRDVTDRRRHEETLERHRLLVNAVKEYALFMLDPEGRVASWNPGAERIKGYAAPEILGRHFRVFYPPEDREQRHPERNLEAALAQGQHEEEAWRVRKDGARFWARVTITPIRDAAGRLRGFAKVTRDLTERRLTEESLRKRMRQHAVVSKLGVDALRGLPLQDVFERAVADLKAALDVDYTKILQLDPDGGTLTLRAGCGWQPQVRVHEARVSAGRESQAGYTLATEGPVIVEDLREETRFHGPPLLLDHGVVSGASVVIHGIGKPWGVLGVHARTRRAFTQDDVHFLQSVANVLANAIQRRVFEESLERRVEERTQSLERAVRDLQTFTNSASHDLRAPIRGVDALLGALLEDHAARLPQEARELAERAARENRRAGRLVQDLLGFARSGQADIHPQTVDLTRLAREVADEIDKQHPGRGTRWRIQEDMRVSADPKLLRIALFNLLDNASKYSSRAPDPRVEIFSTPQDGAAAVSIRDNGVGFDPAEAYRLFQPFHRLASAKGFEGTGLGLTTVHRIITRHGGRIEAHSAPGEGATIRFLLPAAPARATPPAPGPEAEEP